MNKKLKLDIVINNGNTVQFKSSFSSGNVDVYTIQRPLYGTNVFASRSFGEEFEHYNMQQFLCILVHHPCPIINKKHNINK